MAIENSTTPDYVYVLRCVPENMTTTKGFVWPTEGPVECPDWDPSPECGHGLHGWLWGEGDLHAAGFLWENKTAKWLVVKVEAKSVVCFDGKCKFPKGEVVFIGDRTEAANRICELGAPGAVHFATRATGDYGTATAGHYGTATAGNCGTATAGHGGTATAGHGGTATAGYKGKATAGVEGTATAGDCGTATAGYKGTATAGVNGTATVGEGGTLMIKWYNSLMGRYYTAIGYVGEDGIEANTPYVVRDGKLIKV